MKFRLDPTDLQALYAEVGQPLHLSRVACRAEALNVLPEMLHGWPQVLIVEDDTDMRRGDNDLKPLVHQLLEGHGFEVAVVELRGSEGEALSTTPQHISRVVGELRSGQAVLALGSGTITDITKHAVYVYESEPGRSPPLLVGVPTANSVVAYASSLAVVLKGGVKRTLPSRLPDALVLDTQTLGDAPYAYRLGGVGDCSVVMTSFADLYLASVTGMGRWSDTSWEVVQDLRALFLGRSPTLADRGIVGAEVLGKAITLGGIAMTYAGESAPLSGYEHVISHMLDMSARHFGRPVGNHGSQCGLGTMLTAVAYQRLLAELRPGRINLDACYPSEEEMQARVTATFADIDPSGAMGAECWSDYRQKLGAWQRSRHHLQRFLAEWPRHRARLDELTASPGEVVGALSAASHPLRFEDLDVPITREQVGWAFRNAHLMRKRMTIGDLLFHLGMLDSAFADEVLDEAAHLASAA